MKQRQNKDKIHQSESLFLMKKHQIYAKTAKTLRLHGPPYIFYILNFLKISARHWNAQRFSKQTSMKTSCLRSKQDNSPKKFGHFT